MIADGDLSEDVVQETFLKVWMYMLRGGEIKKMRSFLFYVLNKVIIDTYRKRKTLSLDALSEHGFEASIDDSERLKDMLDGKTAFALLSKLPVADEEVLRMKYVQGLSLEEMSARSGSSKNTLAVRVHRALLSLRILSTEGRTSRP